MMIDSAILKLKKRSSANAGSGNTIIDSIMMMRRGAASALVFWPLSQRGSFKLFIASTRYQTAHLRQALSMRDSKDQVQAAHRGRPGFPDARRRIDRRCEA